MGTAKDCNTATNIEALGGQSRQEEGNKQQQQPALINNGKAAALSLFIHLGISGCTS